jgi:phosphatidylserine/phosphatidylglycerophosphate/cardiolipin synthase-like enzyme
MASSTVAHFRYRDRPISNIAGCAGKERLMDQHDMPAATETGQDIPFIVHGSYPRRGGNLFTPLVDSAPAFRRICEAVEQAQHSVWITVTFIATDFQMPDGRGSIFDVLDRAVERGLDVRVIFWRPNPESNGYGQTFAGTSADFDLLAARGSRFLARWDCAPLGYCHHQKSWLIDAGQSSETAFVGGINPTFAAVEPGHMGDGQRHDIYVEIAGPSASDVHHNFVQRWNEASQRNVPLGVWGHDSNDCLSFPTDLSDARGHCVVQIQRNVHAGCYRDPHAALGSAAYYIVGGERSITDQYLLAINAARRSIYLENQALPVPEIAYALEEALKRGVRVVLLVPGEPEEYLGLWRHRPERKPFFDRLEALGGYEHFTLTGIAGQTQSGGRKYVYVHAKIMLIDDTWATIGSCNLHANSLFGHSEMNAAVWDRDVVRALRCQLLLEHLGQDTEHLDDLPAMQLYQRIARENAARWGAGDADWQGLACSLNPSTYGESLAR